MEKQAYVMLFPTVFCSAYPNAEAVAINQGIGNGAVWLVRRLLKHWMKRLVKRFGLGLY